MTSSADRRGVQSFGFTLLELLVVLAIISLTVGTVVLVVNATLLWLYSLSCHACRHLCGGQVRSFAKHPIRHKFWKFVTPLNAKHMNFAWASLVFVALTDVYVRLVASGALTDYKLF